MNIHTKNLTPFVAALTSYKTTFHSLPVHKVFRLAVISWMIALPIAARAISLNQLDSCDDLERSFTSLNHSIPQSQCTVPTGPIGRQIRRSLGSARNQVCFLRNAPSDSLNEFDCLRYDVGSSPSLVCYREISESSIQEYKTNYRLKYALIESEYLAKAKTCSVSNGDTSNVKSTMFPPILAVAGEQQLGFVSSLGNTRPANAAAVHGFATSSPEVARSGVASFEYFSVYRTAEPAAIKPGDLYGNWRLRIEGGDGEQTAIERLFRKAGAQIQVRTIDVEIRRDVQADAYPQSISVTSPMAESVKTALVEEGFNEPSDSELSSVKGLENGDIVSALKKGIPYGQQSNFAQIGRNDKAVILMKTKGLACTNTKRGALGAAILYADGGLGIQTSFGRIAVFVFGLGECARREDPQRRFLSGLIDDARSNILAALPTQ